MFYVPTLALSKILIFFISSTDQSYEIMLDALIVAIEHIRSGGSDLIS
jgi:hypothetical protein